jgi:cysteine desulfurase
VLIAMGASRELARSAVRFSFGAGNTDEDVDRILSALQNIVGRLRSFG